MSMSMSTLRFQAIATQHSLRISTLSDIIITDYILTDTCFHGHNYSRSRAVSGKFFIFRTAKTNFHLNEFFFFFFRALQTLSEGPPASAATGGERAFRLGSEYNAEYR